MWIGDENAEDNNEIQGEQEYGYMLDKQIGDGYQIEWQRRSMV